MGACVVQQIKTAMRVLTDDELEQRRLSLKNPAEGKMAGILTVEPEERQVAGEGKRDGGDRPKEGRRGVFCE